MTTAIRTKDGKAFAVWGDDRSDDLAYQALGSNGSRKGRPFSISKSAFAKTFKVVGE